RTRQRDRRRVGGRQPHPHQVARLRLVLFLYRHPRRPLRPVPRPPRAGAVQPRRSADALRRHHRRRPGLDRGLDPRRRLRRPRAPRVRRRALGGAGAVRRLDHPGPRLRAGRPRRRAAQGARRARAVALPLMDRFLQYAVAGLSAGSLYALVALGIVLIYKSTRVLNFAHGDVATLGTFAAFALLSRDHSFWIAFPVALLSGAAVSVLFYFGALAPAQRKGATLLGQVILTIGLALIVQGFVVWAFGTEPDRMPFPLSDSET